MSPRIQFLVVDCDLIEPVRQAALLGRDRLIADGDDLRPGPEEVLVTCETDGKKIYAVADELPTFDGGYQPGQPLCDGLMFAMTVETAENTPLDQWAPTLYDALDETLCR